MYRTPAPLSLALSEPPSAKSRPDPAQILICEWFDSRGGKAHNEGIGAGFSVRQALYGGVPVSTEVWDRGMHAEHH